MKKEILKVNIKEEKEQLKADLNNALYDSKIDGGAFIDYNDGIYICDMISEIADYNVDIYYNELFEWAKNNYSVIEEANEELGAPNDIIKQIQQGEFLQNERDIYDNLSEMLLLYSYNVLLDNGIDTLTSEEQETLQDYINGLDNNNYLPSYEDISEAIYESE